MAESATIEPSCVDGPAGYSRMKWGYSELVRAPAIVEWDCMLP